MKEHHSFIILFPLAAVLLAMPGCRVINSDGKTGERPKEVSVSGVEVSESVNLGSAAKEATLFFLHETQHSGGLRVSAKRFGRRALVRIYSAADSEFGKVGNYEIRDELLLGEVEVGWQVIRINSLSDCIRPGDPEEVGVLMLALGTMPRIGAESRCNATHQEDQKEWRVEIESLPLKIGSTITFEIRKWQVQSRSAHSLPDYVD